MVPEGALVRGALAINFQRCPSIHLDIERWRAAPFWRASILVHNKQVDFNRRRRSPDPTGCSSESSSPVTLLSHTGR
jgi:hypothetical protein